MAIRSIAAAFFLFLLSGRSAGFEDPPFRVVDLAISESAEIELSNGKKATVRLLSLEETRDEVCTAGRNARVKVEVNGRTVTLVSATYHLPVTVAGGLCSSRLLHFSTDSGLTL